MDYGESAQSQDKSNSILTGWKKEERLKGDIFAQQAQHVLKCTTTLAIELIHHMQKFHVSNVQSKNFWRL